MSYYKRANIPDGTFFFTVKTEQIAPIIFNDSAVKFLGKVLRETKRLWPTEINAICDIARSPPHNFEPCLSKTLTF
ncbi:MAG TPA: hypothetical protein DD473_22700 [Planctomycetaceae bacterium]|nr:hypothetical protein [Planctomycetaceae bacterium]